MKTIVIWDDGTQNIKFFVVPFDCSHLDGKYINGDASDGETQEILEMTQDEGGRSRHMLEEFPIREFSASLSTIKVIVCGFVP